MASLAVPVASLQAATAPAFTNPYTQVNEEFLYWTWNQKLVERETDLSPQSLMVTLITNIIIRLGLTHQITVLTKSLKCVLPTAAPQVSNTVDIQSLEELKYEDTLKFQEVPYWVTDNIAALKKDPKDQNHTGNGSVVTGTKQPAHSEILGAFDIQDVYARYIKIEMIVDSASYIFIAKVQTKCPAQ